MGGREFDPDDPETEAALTDLKEQARRFGSNVIELPYPGRLVVYYGTNHDYQYEASSLRPEVHSVGEV